MATPLPAKPELKCPRCRQDIGGLLSLEQLRETVKRLERRLARAQMAIKAADRKRAAVGLRRMIMNETGLELNITDGGKKLGLRQLSEEIAEMCWEEQHMLTSENASGPISYDERFDIARKVEKLIVDYFTS